MKKKVLAIMLVAVSIMLISACGKKEKEPTISCKLHFASDVIANQEKLIAVASNTHDSSCPHQCDRVPVSTACRLSILILACIDIHHFRAAFDEHADLIHSVHVPAVIIRLYSFCHNSISPFVLRKTSFHKGQCVFRANILF